MDARIDFKLQQVRVDELIGEEKYTDALALAAHLMEQQPPIGVAVNLHWARAKAYTGLGDWPQAEAAWTRVLDFLPDNSEVYKGRAAAREGAGDVSGANADCARAAELHEKLKQLLRRTAAHPIWDRVTELYTQAVERHQGKPRNICTPAGQRSNGRIADWDHVEAACTRAIARNPANPLAHYRRAFVHYCKQNWDALIADCSRAIGLNRQYADAYNLRASAYDKKGDLEKAIEDWTRVIELNPEDVRAYTLRGFAHDELGNDAMATADRLRAYELSKPRKHE